MELLEQLWDDGVTVVTAAGNNGPGAGTVTAPGISRKVITVGASDDRSSPGERRGGYSGSGPTGCCIMKPEILAPGTNIVSLDHHGALYSRKVVPLWQPLSYAGRWHLHYRKSKAAAGRTETEII